MYTPSPFLETDLSSLDWLVAHDSFGTLISMVEGIPFASHLPILYRRDGNSVALEGHWARPNPQWKAITGQRALFIFHGPHAYVSPRWYTEPNRYVPTWNYAAAHLYGEVQVIQESERLAEIVSRLAEKYEAGATVPWRFEDSSGFQGLPGIVGFELLADTIQIKFKLNQNHPAQNVDGVIAGLAADPTDDSTAIAALMRAALAKRAR